VQIKIHIKLPEIITTLVNYGAIKCHYQTTTTRHVGNRKVCTIWTPGKLYKTNL